MKGTTSDEKFIIALYEATTSEGEEHDRFAVGKKVGLQPKAIDTIVRHLAQCNFVKKSGDTFVILTSHGRRLAESLLHDQ